MHHQRALAVTTIVAALVAASLSGCSTVSSLTNDGVANPMTPDQSKTQVMDAARDVVHNLQLSVSSANFSRSSCNDQGDPPFRGEVNIFYPRSGNLDEADAALKQMTQRLQSVGWAADSSFQSHGTTLKKNNVDAVFYPANVSVPQGHIVLFGECRDVTTTKAQAGTTEDVTFT
jgi:uncharacterized protein YceK